MRLLLPILLTVFCQRSIKAAEVAPLTVEEKQRTVAALIQKLASDEFAAREKAEKELKALDKQYLPQLVAAFGASKDTEVKARSVRILRAVRTRDDHIVIRIDEKDGEATAIFGEQRFALQDSNEQRKLIKVLEEQIATRIKNDDLVPGEHGEIFLPVKLQVAENTGMRDVQQVVMALAVCKLLNIQYQTRSATVDMPLPAGRTHAAIEVPADILKKAEIEDGAKEADIAQHRARVASLPKTVRIHVRHDQNAQNIYETEKGAVDLAGIGDFIKKEAARDSIVVTVSYDAQTMFKHVQSVFKTCMEQKVKECRLVPLRATGN
jgi:hypothetical protein